MALYNYRDGDSMFWKAQQVSVGLGISIMNKLICTAHGIKVYITKIIYRGQAMQVGNCYI